MQPNLYELRGTGIEVTFSSSSLDGKPRMTIRRGRRTSNFAGSEIRQLKTEIGALQTVTLESVPDLQTKTFTLVIPAVNIPDGKQQQAMATIAVITTTKTSIAGPQGVQGVIQTYRTVALRGNAKQVVFFAEKKATA
jgi:hypothetical protein